MSHTSMSCLLSLAAMIIALEALPISAAEIVSSPLVVQPLDDVHPVLAADGKVHLLYDLMVVNQSPFAVTIDAIAVVDRERGTEVATLAGSDLAAVTRLTMLGGDGTVLQPSQSSLVFVDVTGSREAMPTSILNRLTATQREIADGTGNFGGITVKPEAGSDPTITFDTPAIYVDNTPAIVLVPPVHGVNWIMFRGCCDLAASHRGGTNAYNGAIHVTERFAIDFVQMNETGLMITGPGNEVDSYVHYGQPVYAVADGTIVSARNNQPTQVPGSLATVSQELASGNAVVIDIGGGAFAFYAHMQPGSVTVQAGDHVTAGQQIGRIGNSGRTIGPHLHFHISTSPDIGGDGLPFVISEFAGTGALSGDALMLALTGRAATVIPEVLAGPHLNEMPLNNQVVDFGGK
jgi:hypothetical protein